MKGIILAGGSGTRLYPLTQFMSKQLLLVNDNPMIFYPLSLLIQAGIKEILVITAAKDAVAFQQLLGDGSHFGIALEYAIQHNPEGIGQAFIIGESFIGDDDVCLILGDNFFYGDSLNHLLKTKCLLPSAPLLGASVFGYSVNEPEHYGVAEFDEYDRIIAIEEKPQHPKSNVVVTGLYCYDSRVIDFAKQLTPSIRGELEITSINQMYLHLGELTLERLGSDVSWFDMGTFDKLNQVSLFIKQIEQQTGKRFACIHDNMNGKNVFHTSIVKTNTASLNIEVEEIASEISVSLKPEVSAMSSHTLCLNKVPL